MPDFSATKEVIMHEPGGDFTRIIFRREQRDVTLPAATFDQTRPEAISTIRKALGDGP